MIFDETIGYYYSGFSSGDDLPEQVLGSAAEQFSTVWLPNAQALLSLGQTIEFDDFPGLLSTWFKGQVLPKTGLAALRRGKDGSISYATVVAEAKQQMDAAKAAAVVTLGVICATAFVYLRR
ncbi:hypothetical protein CYMTET_30523 [Cymbomonas tetramitiformis]|uniref:Uncharacterized protein n=1 Tax=Cymbomonas tetramitiformis TaxID=36881 RepID=A0AAE0FIY1_9CHLO|nr:hypothetical protein CYMTET_30523 [Cymbomonas tetramitiformis]